MSPATRSSWSPSGRRPSPLQAGVWIGGLLLALLGGLLLADAEARYIGFISSVDDVDVELRWVGVETKEPTPGGGEPRRLTLRFEVWFQNRTPYTLWVEAINTQLYLNGEYAGAYTITEGRYEVPPGGRRAVPLQAVLWGKRVSLYEETARAPGGEMAVVGRVRARIVVEDVEHKVFYPVRGVFSVQEAPGEDRQG